MKKYLFVIPARGGSKGIPGKNTKPLMGKPLIHYSIDAARNFVNDECICLTTDSEDIIQCANETDLKVPFVRPAHLATDKAGSYETLVHALKYYEDKGHTFDALVLLQPTSPFRKKEFIAECLEVFNSGDYDLVVSVKEAEANPYYNLFEENDRGYLSISKQTNQVVRRQDAPVVYQFNGSIYVIKPDSLKNHFSMLEYKKIKKYVMPALYSVDLDEPVDWAFCEFLLEKKYIEL